MTDNIARLGLQIDSGPAVAAKQALTDLVPAAKAAQAATTPLAQAARVAAIATDAQTTSIRGQRLVLRGLAGDLALLSPQLGGVATAAALLYVDNAHLIGGFSGLKSAILSVLTPTNLLIGGTVALAAGAYLLNSAWETTAKQFDDTARSIGSTIGQLRGLASEASIKEIPTDEFLKSSEKFASNIYDAKAGMGTLATLLRANGGAATNFADTMGRVADLVRASSGDTQKQFAILTQAGLPATMEWVRFLSQSSQGLRDAAAAGADLNASEQQLVDKARQFDERWAIGWAHFKNAAINAIIDVKVALNNLIDKAEEFERRAASSFSHLFPSVPGELPEVLKQRNIANGFDPNGRVGYGTDGKPIPQITISKPTNNVVDPNITAHNLSLEQQRISLLGQTATIEQQVRAVEISVAQARAQGVNITDKEVTKLKELAYANQLGLTAIRQQADAFNTESAAIGMSAGQAAKYTAVQNALNQAKREGRPLTDQNIADINREADALGAAAQRADETRFEFDTFQGTFREFGQNLRNGQSAWEAFGEAGKNALGKIADRLMDMATRELWNAAFPSTGGGGGGFLGSLLGGLVKAFTSPTFHSGRGPGESGDGVRLLPASTFDNAPRFHGGVGPGEIAAVIRDDESVLTPGQMRAMGARTSVPSITMAPVYNFYNADPGSEARMRAYVDQSVTKSQGDTLQAVQNFHRKSPGNYLPAGG
jgi:hypothetical protein